MRLHWHRNSKGKPTYVKLAYVAWSWILTNPFSLQCQNLSWLSWIFIIDLRVVSMIQALLLVLWDLFWVITSPLVVHLKTVDSSDASSHFQIAPVSISLPITPANRLKVVGAFYLGAIFLIAKFCLILVALRFWCLGEHQYQDYYIQTKYSHSSLARFSE